MSGEEGGKGEGEEEGDEIREYFYYVSDQGNLYVINKEEVRKVEGEKEKGGGGGREREREKNDSNILTTFIVLTIIQ